MMVTLPDSSPMVVTGRPPRSPSPRSTSPAAPLLPPRRRPPAICHRRARTPSTSNSATEDDESSGSERRGSRRPRFWRQAQEMPFNADGFAWCPVPLPGRPWFTAGVPYDWNSVPMAWFPRDVAGQCSSSYCCSSAPGDFGSLQEKLSRLETDRENLALQVSVLTDQLELQKDKLAEQEALLAEKVQLLERTEQLLKQEVQLKKKIESDRLALMTDIPALKLKLVTSEREKSELESKVKKLETDVVLLRSCLAEKETELITRGGKMSHHGSASSIADSCHHPSSVRMGVGLDFRESSSPSHSRERTPQSEREARIVDKPPVYPRSISSTLPSTNNHHSYRPHTPSRQQLEGTSNDEGTSTPRLGSHHSSTLPRNYQAGQQILHGMQLAESQANLPAESGLRSRKGSTGVSFGKGFFRLRSAQRTCSAPELGDGALHSAPSLHALLWSRRRESRT